MDRAFTSRRRLRKALAGPAPLAVALLAFAWVELIAASDLAHRPLAFALAPAVCLPLIWRRRLPIAAGATTGAAFLVQTIGGVPTNGQISTTLAVMIAVFAIGRHAPRVHAMWGFAILLVEGALSELDFHAAAGDYVFVVALVTACWLAGFALARRAEETRHIAQRAAVVEATADARALEAVEFERRRIARELHDTIAHAITVMVLQAGAAEAVISPSPDRAREALQAVQIAGRGALVDMRHLLSVLRGPELGADLAPQPGISDLGPLVEQFAAVGLAVTLDTEGDMLVCPESVSVSAYRIVREALTNTLRHAGTAAAEVFVSIDATGLAITVTDHGHGVITDHAPGYGLVGMRERVAAFGGEFEAGPGADDGFAVRASFPLAEALVR